VRLFVVCNTIEAAVLQKNITASEMSSVHLLCSTSLNKSVWWNVRHVLWDEQQRPVIYHNYHLDDMFAQVGKYIGSYQDGVYNLTIINASVIDAGEYQCIENNGIGEKSTVSLYVNG
jgi:hypothetical protein